MTALIGESGAGKTTLTWLLLRFLQPQSGKITVNGKSLDNIPAALWQKNLAWVPQDPYLFNDTIFANIKLAKPDADESSIHEAARLAHADEFIKELPLGYDTLIGERGTRLSAGQAQRIALARAFLKDAPLLILDEATSHLDPETDALLRGSLEHLTHGRTVLVIAHQRSTLAKADQVINLSHGKIEEARESKPAIPFIKDDLNNFSSITNPLNQPKILSSLVENKNGGIKRSLTHTVENRLFKLLSPFLGANYLIDSFGICNHRQWRWFDGYSCVYHLSSCLTPFHC